MNDKKRTKICICIAVLMLAAIVVLDLCLGHYLRHTHLIDTKFAHYTGVVLPEPMSIEEAKARYPELFEPAFYDYGEGPLSKGDTLKVLISADIVMVGTGVFIILLYLSITAPNPSKTKLLLGMFIVYIVAAVILFFIIYMHFSNLTYTVSEGEPEIAYLSLGDSL